MTLGTTGWTFSGMNLTTSDAMYQSLVEAVEAGDVSIAHLRQITGHRYPIVLNQQKKTIQFCPF